MQTRILPMISAGARALVERHSVDLRAIVTATNSFVTGPIAREFGIDHLIATIPEERDGCFTGGVSGLPCFREGKVSAWTCGCRDWAGASGTSPRPGSTAIRRTICRCSNA